MTAPASTLGSLTDSLDWLRRSTHIVGPGVLELAEHLLAAHPEKAGSRGLRHG